MKSKKLKFFADLHNTIVPNSFIILPVKISFENITDNIVVTALKEKYFTYLSVFFSPNALVLLLITVFYTLVLFIN